MSYETTQTSSAVYQIENNNSLVNAPGTYRTLMSYSNDRANCPYQSAPGECKVKTVYVVPQYGSVGYSNLTHGAAPTDMNYFNMKDAYVGIPDGLCRYCVSQPTDVYSVASPDTLKERK